MDWTKIRKVIWDYVVITFGMFPYCMAWTSLLIPAGVASGGVTGLCTIIYYGTGFPVSYSFFIINVILLIMAFIILGKGFGFKTIYVILVSTILFQVLPKFNLIIRFDDLLITAIVGALSEAVGIGLILLKGGSTGGTDIVAMIINKFWPISPGRIYLGTDVFIIASILLIPGKTVNDMVYGYVCMVVFSFAVDWVLLGSKSSVQMLIFSDKYDRIADIIINDMDRGATVLHAEGWYSKKERNVLLVICRKQEYSKITNMVKAVDPKAFISISSTNSVYGEGFEEIKTGISPKKILSKKRLRSLALTKNPSELSIQKRNFLDNSSKNRQKKKKGK
ncbi:MAG: YitT family protein [Bacteroidales bacterium]|nr:YitT family protein [Bacteroidales bacterium]